MRIGNTEKSTLAAAVVRTLYAFRSVIGFQETNIQNRLLDRLSDEQNLWQLCNSLEHLSFRILGIHSISASIFILHIVAVLSSSTKSKAREYYRIIYLFSNISITPGSIGCILHEVSLCNR